MITPPTSCFWMVRVEGDAAEFVAHTLSTSTMSDIHEAVLISEDFQSDIQGTISMDEMVEYLKQSMPNESNLVELSDVNPLYMPATPEQLDNVLEGDGRSESLSFTGMDGSPFTLKMVEVSDGENDIIQGKLTCRPFDLPSYSEILKGQKEVRMQ